MSSRLSAPRKMPGASFSLMAGKTCPSSHKTIAEHGDKAICASCYAKKGAYKYPNTPPAQTRRLAEILDSMDNDNGDSWVTAMIAEIRKATATEKYFRIHDSGDFFAVEYVNMWYRIADALPDVKFWAPTREYLSANPDMIPALARLASLPNVTVRPSAVVVDDPVPTIAGLSAGTTVVSKGMSLPVVSVCPSTDTKVKTCDGNNCRKCWDKDTEIAYRIH